MSPLALVFFNLILALVIITVIHFSVRAYLRRNRDNPNAEDDRRKLIVFNLVLAFVVIAIIQVAVWALLRSKPSTVETLMKELNIPADVPFDDTIAMLSGSGMEKRNIPDNASLDELKIPAVVTTDVLIGSMRDEILTRFSTEYSVELNPEETAYLMELLKKNRFHFDLTPYFREVIRLESARQRIEEKALIRQILGETDPSDREKNRIFWSMAAWNLLFRSEEFRNKVEPIYGEFTAWWKRQHREYEEMVEENRLMGSHDELMERYVKALQNETVSFTAHKIEDLLEKELRRRGTALSDAKREKTLALFRRFSGELYTKETMRNMADAIIEETGLTDEEIHHCLLLKDRPLPENARAKIPDIRDRYLKPDPFNEISPESALKIKSELQKITGIDFGVHDDARESGSAGQPDSAGIDGGANDVIPSETENEAGEIAAPGGDAK